MTMVTGMAAAPAQWAEVDLPYGLWRDGDVTRRLRIRALSGFDELALEEALDRGESALAAGTALIARCAANDRGLLEDGAGTLALGDREIVLRAIYAQTLSQWLTAAIDCPECAAAIVFELDLAALVQLPPDPGPEHVIMLNGRPLSLRVLSGADLEGAMGRNADPAVELVAAVGGTLEDRDALAEELARLDPNAECAFDLVCPECGERTMGYLDGFALLQRALGENGGVLAQVDRIARTYGWSEADILALPRARRLRYVAMASA